ncbi:MAG: GNAT family N-acetyltransferase [Oscillospiraceae bacterium]|nr:GNAT family N-acetyltransferase [Oscillospiraceae bacterium]
MIIRTAKQSDIETLLKFRLAYLRESFDGGSYDEAEVTKQLKDYFIRNITSGVFTAYFAVLQEKVVSVIFLIRVEKPANPHFLSGKTAMLMNVYTLEEYRRQGIAETLLQAVITDAKAEGISCIDLTATALGKPLYEKSGFKSRKDGELEMRLNL